MKRLFDSLPLVALLLAACAGSPSSPPDEVDTRPSAICTRACDNLHALGCPEAAPVDAGLTCYQVCARARANTHIDLKPECLAAAPTRAAVRSCGTVRCAD